jgi:16S rRNA (uracil1498-N3)-methyltransferase
VRQFVLPEEPQGGRIEIRGRDFHYLAHVRRVRAGDEFPATDGLGRRWCANVLEVGRESLRLGVEESRTPPGEGDARITLIQALPKSRKMDLIVRQATEAGVWAVLPVLSRHSVVRLGGEEREAPARGRARYARWQRVAREAVQQSGRGLSPQIGEVTELAQAVEALPDDGSVRLLAHPEPLAACTLHECLAGEVPGVVLAVGPEGGFAEEEVRFLRERGFLPVSFGGNVLRTETAALFAVAAVQIVLQEKGKWRIRH